MSDPGQPDFKFEMQRTRCSASFFIALLLDGKAESFTRSVVELLSDAVALATLRTEKPQTPPGLTRLCHPLQNTLPL